MINIRSLRDGSNAAQRALIDSTTTVAAPSGANAYAFNLQSTDWVHLFCLLSDGGTEAVVGVYYWSTIAGQWFYATSITFSSVNGFVAKLEHRGQERIALSVESLDAGRVRIWGGASTDQA